jgi:predicted MFS family arabinose efflux permease
LRQQFQALAAPIRYRNFRLLWFAQISSELGDWAARLALAVLVEERTGSPAITALVTTASVLPYLGLGQLLASIVERFPRRTVVVLSDVLRAGAFIAMAFQLPIAALLLLAFFAGTLTPVFEAARSGITPASVPREHYGDAIALANITFQGALLFGYAAGGGLTAWLGPRSALLVNAGSFLLSAVLFSAMDIGRLVPDQGRPPRLREAWSAVIDDPFVRRFLVTFSICGSAGAVGEALVAAYGPIVLGAGPGVIGALAAAMPVGAIIATVVTRRPGDDRAQLRRASGVALVGAVIATLAFAAGTLVLLAFAGYVGIGIIYASIVPANEVAGLRIPDRVRGTSFSILSGFMLGGQAIAAAVGGLIAHYAGIRPTIAGALIIAFGVSLWGFISPPREARHAVSDRASAVVS